MRREKFRASWLLLFPHAPLQGSHNTDKLASKEEGLGWEEESGEEGSD